MKQLFWAVFWNKMIILDRRDGSGFWVPYTAGYVWAKYECEEAENSWTTKYAQVDLKVC